MTKIEFISIQILCHATESEDKVLKAVRRLYPSFKKRKATGYFGNPIYVFDAHIKRKKEIAAVVDLLKEKCASLKDVRRRIDEKGNLYIRLDKQELYQGRYVLEDSGDVKIIIHITSYPFNLEDAISYAEEVFSH
ncbi:MAG: hypothetical protein HXS48_25980 [Theionarchaea archaeon]|nr:MAG: hypothetical protein AYK19_13235 [Theionarchaea archaeon DG-70-1]MBU7030408.1 hypothetical protein [Theionarchaea archaeon]